MADIKKSPKGLTVLIIRRVIGGNQHRVPAHHKLGIAANTNTPPQGYRGLLLFGLPYPGLSVWLWYPLFFRRRWHRSALHSASCHSPFNRNILQTSTVSTGRMSHIPVIAKMPRSYTIRSAKSNGKIYHFFQRRIDNAFPQKCAAEVLEKVLEIRKKPA